MRETPRGREAVSEQLTARARVLAALLMAAALPPLEACGATVTVGRGDLADIRPQDRPDYEPGLPDFETMVRELSAAIGEDVLAANLEMHRAYREKNWRGGPRLAGFDKLNIQDDDVKKLLATYPASWTGHIGEIRYRPEFRPIPYPGLQGKPEFAHCAKSWRGEPLAIQFSSDGKHPLTTSLIGQTMSHELAHGADWASNPRLDTRKALTLMYLTWLASQDTGRPQFDYVESIKAKDQKDKKTETSARMAEYFAELMELALQTIGPQADDAKDDKRSPKEKWQSNFEKALIDLGSSPDQAKANRKLVELFFRLSEPDFAYWDNFRRLKVVMDMQHNADAPAGEKIP